MEPNQPPRVERIFWQALKVPRSAPGAFATAWAVACIPPRLIVAFAFYALHLGDDIIQRGVSEGASVNDLLAVYFIAVVSLVFPLMAVSMVVAATAKLSRGEPVTARYASSQALAGFPVMSFEMLLWLALLRWCGALPGLLLLFPFCILLPLSLMVPATVADGIPAWKARSRCVEITKGSRLKAWFSVMFLRVVFIVLWILQHVFWDPFWATTIGAHDWGGGIAGMMMNTATFALAAWGAVCITRYYLDLAAWRSAQH